MRASHRFAILKPMFDKHHLLAPLNITTLTLSAILLLVPLTTNTAQARTAAWWPASVTQAINKAGANRKQLLAALRQVPLEQREGMQFLIENMPDADLQTLSLKFLLQEVALAYAALHSAPWQGRIPSTIFLNDVLPYTCLNETRDASREALRQQSVPLIADCKTPTAAAQRLNQKLFPLLKVRYSTERKQADQSPLESMASGLASCSGLSILLVDACRSVGIPARVVGTPLWMNGRGNHTWVEIWDGDWHFTGAAEPDAQGLDHGWFTGDAAQARGDMPQHAIYASSYQKTGLAFPLVWAPEIQWINAVNVTGRYAAATPTATDKTRVLVKVLDPGGKRVAAKITISDAITHTVLFTGISKDETADTNDMIAFALPYTSQYKLDIEYGGKAVHNQLQTATQTEAVVAIYLQPTPPRPPGPPYASPAITKPLPANTVAQLNKALNDYFAAPAARQASWIFPNALEALLQRNEPAVRRAAWDAYRATPHSTLQQDFTAKQVQFETYRSAYTLKTVGTRPAGGWPLFIAMHGGGGAPKELNDSQWEMMQIYYKAHPEVGGYQYLALRAPNDTWNGFYDVYVYPLVGNLIKQFLLYGDVDPNKVFLMGYSHGGYGAFAIGPKMPDHFAAIHASASAPTDGETTPKTLRNTVFTVMVGDQDTMYDRLERDRKFDTEVKQLRGERTDIYPVQVQIMAGFGHGGLPDRDKIVDMYSAVRNPVPCELTWLMTDDVIHDFFWLHTDAPGKEQEIDATCRDNHITVTTSANVKSATVLLDSRLVDFQQPLMLTINGKTTRQHVAPSLRVLCATLAQRGDPELASTAQIDVKIAN